MTVAGVAVAALLAVDAGAADASALVAAVPSARPTVTATATAAAAVPVTEAADLVSARVSARSQGRRVEAVSERTDFLTTFVNPDGTLTTEVSSAPVRFRSATTGAWLPVDLTLKQVGAAVAPSSSDRGVTFSGGGAAGSAFVTVDHPAAPPPAAGGSGAKSAPKNAPSQGAAGTKPSAAAAKPSLTPASGVSWALGGRLSSFKLPKPTLSGRVATYADVAPGVDLRLAVRPGGFEQDFVLKSRTPVDALVSGGGSWSIPLATTGLTPRAAADGGVDFVNAAGQVASRIPPAFAWDAAVDPRSGEALKVPVRLSVAQTDAKHATLTVTPDAAWISNPARVFPITIDPTYTSMNVGPIFDTWAATNYDYPNNDMSQDPELKVGTYDGGATKARSYMTFQVAPFRGLQIKAASLSLYETHSLSCDARPVSAYNAAAANTATRWSNKPPNLALAGSVTTAKGFSSACAAGWISIPVTGQVAAWAATNNMLGAFALAASETDSYGWKRFSSSEGGAAPKLTITYNRAPGVPAAPTFSAGAQTYAGAWYASSLTPTITAKATDPDGNAVKLTTDITASTTAGAAVVTSCTTGLVASAAAGTCTVPGGKLADNRTYYMHTRAADDQGLLNASYSGFTAFSTANAAPANASISCPAPYTANGWVDTPPASTATCTVTTVTPTVPTSPGVLYWTIDGGPEQYSGTWPRTAAVPVDLAHSGQHRLTAYTRSKAGVKSASGTTYTFGTGGVAMSYPEPGKTTTATGPIKIQMTGPPKGAATSVTGKLKWRLAGSTLDATTGWYTDTLTVPAALTGPAGGAVVNTAWDVSKADTDPAPGIQQPAAMQARVPVKLDVQVCLTYTGTTSVEKCTWATAPSSVLRVPHAFGNGFPTTDAGPGQVALFTGEFNTSTTDVTVPGYTGALSLSRSHATYGNLPSAAIPPSAAVFGPGWTAGLDGTEAGLGQLIPYDGTRDDGTVAFLDGDGTALVYQVNAAGARRTGADLTAGTWTPTDEQTRLSGTTLKVAGTGTATVLTLTEVDGTATTFGPAGTAFVPTTTGPGRFTVKTVVETTGATTTTSTDAATGRVSRILAPIPAGMTAADCPDPTTPDLGALKAGCRALRLTYATTTAGTQVAGQLSQVNLEIWSPTTLPTTDCAGTSVTAARTGNGFISVPVACYSYNAAKQLAAVKDPRNGLTTSYTYGSSNQLLTITPPGKPGALKPYTIGYTPTSDNQLQVTSVTRTNAADTGSTDLARIVYQAAPSAGNAVSGSQIPDLSATTVSAWGQPAAPTYAAAVFGPDYTGPVTGTGIDWRFADLSYTDPQGYTTNTATFGAGRWLYDYTQYDTAGLGNVVFTLDGQATATILDAKAAGTPVANVPGLGTTTVYNLATTTTPPVGLPANTPAGAVVTDVYAPARTATLPGGATSLIRPRTHTDYDQGAPNAGLNPTTGATTAEQKGYALPTTVTTWAADSTENAPPASTTAPVTARTITAYAPKPGAPAATSGWALGKPTTTTTDMDLSGTVNAGDVTATSYTDELGRTVEKRQPTSTGTDAGTTLTGYYTATAQTGTFAACGSTPQWAGQVCRTTPANQPAGVSVPDEATTGYSYLLAPTTVQETSGAVTRTTTTAYRPDGRIDSTGQAVTGLASSTPRDRSYRSYDPDTGALTATATKNTAGTVTGSVETSTDGWGRTLTTTTATTGGPADTGTTAYDAAGRVATISDAKGVTTYGYDGVTTDAGGTQRLERRGLTTKVTVTRTGTSQSAGNLLTYTGAYDTAGKLTTQTLPGALRQNLTYDQTGQLTGMEYTGQVTPYTETTDPDTGQVTYTPGTPGVGAWLGWSQDRDTTGRVVREYNSDGAGFTGLPGVTNPAEVTAPTAGRATAADTLYGYDQAGRLTSVNDRRATATGTTLDPGTTPDPATACTVRGYTFDGNGNRTNLTTTGHRDGDCAGTDPTTLTTTTSTTSGYDAADRPTTGTNSVGSYVYDGLGRQTTLPAADAPDPTKGPITLGYYDNDLPKTITQAGATTSYSLDSADRRLTSTTGPTGTADGQPGTAKTTRHYTDSGDNPAWAETTTIPAGGGAPADTTTRYTDTLTGDLGARIDDTPGSPTQGAATLSLANPHGDTVTTVTIPAGTTETVPAVTISGWATYSEYGATTPGTDPATTSTVGGAIGYGWLGAKQRSTPTEAAGLTLMGVRLYNHNRSLFTSMDPIPGGNTTAYTYPQDPINGYDIDGRCWGPSWVCNNPVTRAVSSRWNNAVSRVKTAYNTGAAKAKNVYSRVQYIAKQWKYRNTNGRFSWGPAPGHRKNFSWFERLFLPTIHLHWDLGSQPSWRGIDFYPSVATNKRIRFGRSAESGWERPEWR